MLQFGTLYLYNIVLFGSSITGKVFFAHKIYRYMALELLLKAHRHALALLNRVHQFTSYFYLFPPFTIENAEQSFLPQRAPLPHEIAGRAGEAMIAWHFQR